MSSCLIHFYKAEDPAAYAKLANNGLMLAYPVKIGGQSHRPDNNIEYHNTVKYFDPEKDHAHQVHQMAQHLPLNPPDAKNTQVKFDTFKDRLGNDVHVISLHGNSAEKNKEHHSKFSHMGHPEKFEWNSHISTDKATWNKVKNSNPKTAHEAGIQFGPAELKRGPKTLKTYHHEPDSAEPKFPDQGDMTAKIGKKENELGAKPLMKPYVSEAQRRWAHTPTGKKALGGNAGVHEWDEATKGKKLPEKVSKSLEKGALKNAGMALGMAGALAGAAHPSNAQSRQPASIQHKHVKTQTPMYDHQKMLRAIAQVESSGGVNTKHGEGGGPIHGHEHAYGKYGIMPETIRETIKGYKDLKAKHGKALALKGKLLHNYMHDHPELENIIADRHLSHMEHVLGKTPEHLGFGWLEGIQGTLDAKNRGEDIKNHWHAKKVRAAYDKEK